MRLAWLEAVLPLGIIAGMLCVMGNAQYYIHKAAHGRVTHSLSLSPFYSFFFGGFDLGFWSDSDEDLDFLVRRYSRSTSATTSGTSPWREGTRSSWKKLPRLLSNHGLLFFSFFLGIFFTLEKFNLDAQIEGFIAFFNLFWVMCAIG